MSRSGIAKLETKVIMTARWFKNMRLGGTDSGIERAAKSLCAAVEALDYAKFLEKQPPESTGSTP